MADNTQLNSMTGGDDIATDDIASVKYQRIKLIHGADGVNDGDISSANGLPTTHDITALNHGVKTITTAGVDESLATTTTCKKVVIQSQTDNIGFIAIGGAGVDATEATGTGIILYPGDSVEIQIDDLASIFLDSTVSGEGVRYTYYT